MSRFALILWYAFGVVFVPVGFVIALVLHWLAIGFDWGDLFAQSIDRERGVLPAGVRDEELVRFRVVGDDGESRSGRDPDAC